MKRFLLFSGFFCFFLGFSFAQGNYSRVKVRFSTSKTAFQLARLGIDISHGEYAPGKHFTGEISSKELQMIKAAGFDTEVLIPDLTAYFLEKNQSEVSAVERDEDCNNGGATGSPYDIYETPANYQNGSMGGYFTYQEMLDNLDAMAEQYPNLITARTPIDDFLTHEDRPIYWVKISDNPTNNEAEPEVVYTAVHHAREPNSMAQMIFYLWYLLENYETDEEVKYLVDNTEMYFVPCLNPDGYIFNETNEPNGGGFWRKNRRNNGDGTMGVDLNRNYGYEWGINDNGSSPNPDSDVYRGPEPFSEPETQAIKAFCEAHEFQIAQNYHTYGNLLIHPWGYDDSPTPEDALFKAMAVEMTTQNNFTYGTGIETVGYNVNGDSDDWFYGEQTTKEKIYAFTPEVGPASSGFWPVAADIDNLNKSCMYLNLATAHLVLNYGVAKDVSEDLVTEIENELEVDVQKLGLQDGQLTVALKAVSDNILSISAPQVFDLDVLETAQTMFEYELNPDVQAGEELVFVLAVDNGVYTAEDTLRKLFFAGDIISQDNGDNLDNWQTTGTWAATDEDFFSASSSITDSPNSDYQSNAFNIIESTSAISVADAQSAFLRFRAKWDIEADYDWVQLQVKVNGGDFIPLCGMFTNPAVLDQGQEVFEEPIYDGVQNEWVLEQIDLTDLLAVEGTTDFIFRFVLYADGFVTGDGYYFDDFEILTNPIINTETITLNGSDFTYNIYPNPATNFVIIETNTVANGQVIVRNALGQEVMRLPLTGLKTELVTDNLKSGIYFYSPVVEGQVLPAKSIAVVK